jgi:hypothetical protein
MAYVSKSQRVSELAVVGYSDGTAYQAVEKCLFHGKLILMIYICLP